MSRTSTAALAAVALLSGAAWLVGSADTSDVTVTTTAALPPTTTSTQAESPSTAAPTTTTMPAARTGLRARVRIGPTVRKRRRGRGPSQKLEVDGMDCIRDVLQPVVVAVRRCPAESGRSASK